MTRFVLSPVGTSVLTNQANAEERKLLNQHANARKADCPAEVCQLVDRLADQALRALRDGDDVRTIRRKSAELNGIYGLYDDQLAGGQRDQHFLIATDTLQGHTTAECVAAFLREKGCTAQVYTPRNLSTKDPDSFDEGMKELLCWCDETIPGYRAAGYEIVFNLTGGFKSLQGVLNTIGMFYADRIIYIFETGGLIKIPRLPVRLDVELFRHHAALMMLLAAGHSVPADEVRDLPEALIDVLDGEAILSLWGELVWNQAKGELLSGALIELPHLTYTDSFQRDFRNTTTAAEKVKLQETLAKASKILVESDGSAQPLKQDGGLQYEDFTNQHAEGRPIGHFRVTLSLRVSCLARDGGLALRHYGAHDYVKDNP